jgi:hypothetical protein
MMMLGSIPNYQVEEAEFLKNSTAGSPRSMPCEVVSHCPIRFTTTYEENYQPRMNSPCRANDKLFMSLRVAANLHPIPTMRSVVPLSFIPVVCCGLFFLNLLLGGVAAIGQETSTLPDAPQPSQKKLFGQ